MYDGFSMSDVLNSRENPNKTTIQGTSNQGNQKQKTSQTISIHCQFNKPKNEMHMEKNSHYFEGRVLNLK